MIDHVEWRERTRIWLETLRRDYYTVIGSVECSGFTTREMLPPETAADMDFSPMPSGTPWGRKWEYGWFRTRVALPSAAQGRRVILLPGVGGEMLVWVNGKITGSKDRMHPYITLTRAAEPGESFDVLIESYAGHGVRPENGGPYFPGETPVPEPPACQVMVGRTAYAVWNEDAYQLGLDVFALTQLLAALDAKSLRAQKVAEGLRQFTLLVDFEQPAERRNADYRAAREALRPLMECVNGSTAPLFTIFGQSHLDLAWEWPFAETKRKCARTLSTQLALMEEYPEYRFLLCEPPILDTVRANYPELYARIKEKIADGQLIPEGGVYVECDTNIPGGESLIRQFTYGKRWFRKECGCETRMAWMPDTFGFTASLPQIMKGCGIRYFATQKLLRCHPDCDPFPYNIFMWQGIDGSRTLSHLFMKNNSGLDPQLLIHRWETDRRQEEGIDTFLFPFGYGDGGGGPTRDLCEMARRVKDLEGAPRTQMDSPVAFFEDIERKGPPTNCYVGELYLQWHRGAYTSQAKLKRLCRKAEQGLHEAELWSCVIDGHAGYAYPYAELTRLWKMLLFHQFHDVLAGTSIARVNREAAKALEEVVRQSGRLADEAMRVLGRGAGPGKKSGGLTIFNSLSWERHALVCLPEGMAGARDVDGCELPSQTMEGRRYVRVTVPPCGFTSIYPGGPSRHGSGTAGYCRSYPRDDTFILENECLQVVFDAAGQITSILDKETGIQYADGPCNRFRMYKDVNMEYDAWEIGSMYEKLPVETDPSAKVEIICGGTGTEDGLIAALRIRKNLNHSPMVQTVILEQGSRRMDFRTEIEWNERHKLLKVEFPVRVHADCARSEIQFGYVRRPTHRSRRYDADRYEVCQQCYTALAEAGRGFAVLNDGKYGVSVEGGRIGLTLLRAPVIPDMTADCGRHEFTYAFYVYNGPFVDSGVTQSGHELNVPVRTSAGSAGRRSFFTVTGREPHSFSHENVILETVKKADDQSGDLILRLYESQDTASTCVLHSALPISEASETDMLEENASPLPTNGRDIALRFRPFEIKTLRLKLAGPPTQLS